MNSNGDMGYSVIAKGINLGRIFYSVNVHYCFKFGESGTMSRDENVSRIRMKKGNMEKGNN